MKHKKILNIRTELLAERIRQYDIEYCDVCGGIVSNLYIRKILLGDVFPDKLVMDSLMQRVNLETDKYESIVSRREYEIIKKLDDIIECIDEGKINEAINRIEEYDRMIVEKNVVYHQLRELLKGICYMNSGNSEEREHALMIFTEALKMTIYEYDDAVSLLKRYISRMEIILHVVILGIVDIDHLFFGVDEIINEIRLFDKLYDNYDCDETCGVFCYFAGYICNIALYNGMKKEALYVSERALKLLKKHHRTYNVCNLLNIWIQSSEENDNKCKVQWMYEQIKNIYGEFGVIKESYSWCIPYASNEIYSIDYVVKIRRKAMNMTQIDLAEGICTGKTISNIEQGKYTPKPTKMIKILKRLNINFCEYGVIETFDLVLHKLTSDWTDAVNEYDYEICKEMMKLFSKKLEKTAVNRQFLEFKRIVNENVKSGWSDTNNIADLINALELTCKVWNKEVKWIYSKNERNILYHIGDLLFRKGDIKEAERVFLLLLDFFKDQKLSIKHFIKGYSLNECIFGSWYGSIGRLEAGLKISRSNIYSELFYGKSAVTAFRLYDIGWDMERLDEEKQKESIRYMRYAYALGLLTDESIAMRIGKRKNNLFA